MNADDGKRCPYVSLSSLPTASRPYRDLIAGKVEESYGPEGCNHRTSQQGAGDATLLLVTFLMGVCECMNLF